jgi:hypothetical protein
VGIYRISSRRQPTVGGPLAWGLGGGLTTPHHKNAICCESFHTATELDGFSGMT